jgi:hypothetical protein
MAARVRSDLLIFGVGCGLTRRGDLDRLCCDMMSHNSDALSIRQAKNLRIFHNGL